jgi:hypothetical protein
MSGPVAVARLAVGLAVRSLPEGDRLRYRAEFLAELHALSAPAQLRYATGVLSQTFALRAALGSSPTRAEEAAMTLVPAKKQFFWRCRVFRLHRWVTHSAEDGSRSLVCSRCGRDRGVVTVGGGNTIGA